MKAVPSDAVGASPPAAPPVWDVAIRKTLRADHAQFELDVVFRSHARRLVLFGPSGAGKSLTLRAVAGLLRPDAGHIRCDGAALFDTASDTDLPPRSRRLGLLAQDPALFPHLTARQNVASGLRPARWWNPRRRPAGADGACVDAWMARMRLQGHADQYPDQLSGGQAQRAALARALAASPRALLLDEPFSALDIDLRGLMRQEVLALQERLGLPLLLITHDPDDVRVFAEHVVRLDGGRVVE